MNRLNTLANKDQKHSVFDSILVLVLFSTLHFGAKFTLNLGVKITPADIAILLLFFLKAITKQFIFKLDHYTKILLLLILINSLIEFLSVIFIDQGMPENITLGVALIRNAALIFLIVNLSFDNKILKWIVIAGATFSTVAILFYIKALLNLPEIIVNPILWEPGVFYSLDQGVLRLQGLNDDPNFYFIVNLIPLFLSVFLLRQKFNIWALLMFLIILLSSILTFSRTGIILLCLMFLALLIKKNYIYKITMTGLFIAMIFSFSWYLSASMNIPTLYDIFIERFEKGIESGGSGRLELWKIALDGFLSSYIFGHGGRYTLRKAGNYTHNDYLEMLSNHGLIGFAGMTSLYLYIIFYIIAKNKVAKEAPIFSISSNLFFFLLIAAVFFTIYYNPYIWFVVAFIFSKNRSSPYHVDKNFN